jgi:flagellar motor switch protein FliM
MAEVLSQSEIDALLEAMSTGEIKAEPGMHDKKKIKPYDFKRAVRFSKDQIRNLTRIHENYARLLSTYLSAQLRTLVQIEVVSADQLPYEEFIRSIPTTTILHIFEGKALEGRMLMEYNPRITYAILDRLFGGSGASVISDNRQGLTEIEKMVLEKVFRRSLELFHEAWKELLEVQPRLVELETNPQFTQIVSPNETVIVISFSMKIGETTGMMNLCLPYIVLEPIIPKITVHHWLTNKRKSNNEAEFSSLKDRVQQVKLPIIAELGTAHISIEEFLELAVGDVIQLDQPVDTSLNIKIGPTVKFHGRPGTKKGHLAIQIEKVLFEGAEDYE